MIVLSSVSSMVVAWKKVACSKSLRWIVEGCRSGEIRIAVPPRLVNRLVLVSTSVWNIESGFGLMALRVSSWCQFVSCRQMMVLVGVGSCGGGDDECVVM